MSEVFIINGFVRGPLSEREFLTKQSAIAGGTVGAWAGAWAGAQLGTLGGPLAPVTVPLGGIVGGILGGFFGASLGDKAASGIYGRLDKIQKMQVDAFIYAHYGVGI